MTKEEMAWRFTGIAGLKRFMTEVQYQAQTPEVKKWYEPVCKCAEQDYAGWIDQKKRPAQPGFIVKRWVDGAIWAGIYKGGAKDSSFDYYINLPPNQHIST